MTSRALLLAIAVGLALASCAVGYRMAPADTRLAVGNSAMTVIPPRNWNRAGTLTGPGKNAELWTLDGPRLNEITFYGDIADGDPLFREFDRRSRPLPRFDSSMLPPDVADLFERSYRLASGTPLFELGEMAPVEFAGHPGFRIFYQYTLQGEEVRREGRATGAIINRQLYMITYEAPAVHYFATSLEDYQAIVASAAIAGPRG